MEEQASAYIEEEALLVSWMFVEQRKKCLTYWDLNFGESSLLASLLPSYEV
jgi:hypothetical protein